MGGNSHKLTVYAMVGPMGAGKTTFALELSKKRNAYFFSLDKTIKEFGRPILSFEDYESNVEAALEILSQNSIQVLKTGQSVVFDFGGGIAHWNWLQAIANAVDAWVEIYHLDAPVGVRRKRVQKRNTEKPKDIYHFTMSNEEFLNSKTKCETPPPGEKVKIIKLES